MEATYMFNNRWVDKAVVVHIHKGILLSHKKEHIWVSPNEVDEPRTYYMQSEVRKRKKILYINSYIWNLGKCYGWAYLQGSNGEADIQNRLVNTVVEGEGGMNWESSMETYKLPYVK